MTEPRTPQTSHQMFHKDLQTSAKTDDSRVTIICLKKNKKMNKIMHRVLGRTKQGRFALEYIQKINAQLNRDTTGFTK